MSYAYIGARCRMLSPFKLPPKASLPKEPILSMRECHASARLVHPPGECVVLNRSWTQSLALWGTRRVSIPSYMLKHLRPGRHEGMLRGQCVILLGDSTTTETAEDLAVLLGRYSEAEYRHFIHNVTRRGIQNEQGGFSTMTTTNERSELHLSFHANHANFTTHSPSDDFVAVHRAYHAFFCGQTAGIGMEALSDPEEQQTIRRIVDAACGARPRTVWLQSGYHDLYSNRGTTVGETYLHGPNGTVQLNPNWVWAAQNAFTFAESLAPRRLWLARHPANDRAMAGRDVSCLEQRVQQLLAARGRTWAYAGYREPWSCDISANFPEGVNTHTGAIHAGFVKPSYCCYFRSMLRTHWAIEQAFRTH